MRIAYSKLKKKTHLTLNGHRKLEAYLKFDPTVKISWITSSVQIMFLVPNLSSMIWLLVRATRCPLIFANPRLYTSSRTDLRLGYPQVIYGSQMRNILRVAVFSLTKTPLFIWRRRKSCRTLRTLGATLLILQKKNVVLRSNFNIGHCNRE